MELLPVIGVCLILGCVPLLLSSYGMIRKWGVGLWIFSPLPVFLFVYLVAFGLLPLGQQLFDFRLYPSLSFDFESFVLAEILGAVACYAFVLGYALPADPKPAALHSHPAPETSEEIAASQQTALGCQKAAMILSILLQAVFIGFMLKSQALTLNFGANRQAYLASL